jgi:hypothetical protein
MPQTESFAKCACQHCGGHIEFPVQGAGQKIACPHCNWETVLSLPHVAPVEIGGGRGARKRIYLASAIAAVVVAAGVVGLYFYLQSLNSTQEVAVPVRPNPSSNDTSVASTAQAPTPRRKPPEDPWHGLKAGKVTLVKTGETSLIYATGTLTNDTARQRFGIKVELEVLDAHRKKLGSATDYTEVIEPGKEWKFRALITAKTATAAKLTSVKEQE